MCWIKKNAQTASIAIWALALSAGIKFFPGAVTVVDVLPDPVVGLEGLRDNHVVEDRDMD